MNQPSSGTSQPASLLLLLEKSGVSPEWIQRMTQFVDDENRGLQPFSAETEGIACYAELLKPTISSGHDDNNENNSNDFGMKCSLSIHRTDVSLCYDDDDDNIFNAATTIKGVMTFLMENENTTSFFPVMPDYVLQGTQEEMQWRLRAKEFEKQLDIIQDDFARFLIQAIFPRSGSGNEAFIYFSHAFHSVVFRESSSSSSSDSSGMSEFSYAYMGFRGENMVLALLTVQGGVSRMRSMTPVGFVQTHMYRNQIKVYVLEKTEKGLLLADDILDMYTAKDSSPKTKKVWSLMMTTTMTTARHVKDVTHAGMMEDLVTKVTAAATTTTNHNNHVLSSSLSLGTSIFFSSIREGYIKDYVRNYEKSAEIIEEEKR